jgi:hypothetical protein
MAQLYASGPVDCWTGVGAGGAPLFLGHGERAPRIQVHRQYKPVHTDLGGEVPHDKGFGGEWGVVSIVLDRYNESTLRIIEDVATVGTPGAAVRGLNNPGEIGSLMLTEGLTYPLWLRFPFSAKPAYSGGSGGPMPAGYRFLAAHLGSPDDLFDLGPPNARKVGLVFECMRAFDVTVVNSYGVGQFLLYDHALNAIAGLAFN